ncbi:MAG: glycosyltransferase family 39 protein [Kiritimatiellae bacterium]|nr:glycosyltransferase family 39 protein [Kiritimatiellia bacterium]
MAKSWYACLLIAVFAALFCQRPVVAVAVVLAGAWPAASRRAQPLRSRLQGWFLASSPLIFQSLLFMAGALFYATLSWGLFHGLPVLDDDVSALMQARIFAAGRVTLPLPPLPEFFGINCWLDARHGLDHMCSMYPPGHPAILLPGVLAGVPWLITPLFGGGLAVMTVMAARELFDETTARVTGILTLCSPFVAELAATHLSHVPTAFFLTMALRSVCRMVRRGDGWRDAWLAGLGMGMAFLCRPLTAMTIGLVLALAPLWYWRRGLRAWRQLLLTAAIVLAAVAVLSLYTDIITGDWRLPGHELGMGQRGKYGFVRLDRVRTHTIAIGIQNTLARVGAINFKLLGWPVPSLLVALLPVFLRRADKRDLWLWLMPLALLGVYMPFWYYEACFPARYIFCGMPMLIMLAARATLLAARRFQWPAASLLVPLLSCNLALFLPGHLNSFGPNHWDVEHVLPRVVKAAGIRNAVVFMDGIDVLPNRVDLTNDFYATGFIRNNLSLDGDIVYARNRRGDNWRLARLYPGRNYYLYRYDRQHNRAQLWRIVFDGEQQQLIPRHG